MDRVVLPIFLLVCVITVLAIWYVTSWTWALVALGIFVVILSLIVVVGSLGSGSRSRQPVGNVGMSLPSRRTSVSGTHFHRITNADLQ